MHEYSIVQALLERVELEARTRGASRVDRIRVRLGSLSGVEPELLETAYATFRERTICASAALELERVPARWCCSRCGRDVPAGALLRCSDCGAAARLESGDEIVLERIEMEVPHV